MDQTRLAVLLTLVAVLATVSFFAYRHYYPKQATHTSSETAKGIPETIVEGLEQTTFTVTGQRQYQMSAERVVHYSNSDTAQLSQPRMNFYSDSSPWQIQAARGRLEKASEMLTLEGDVALTKTSEQDEELSLTTDALTIYPKKEKAFTEAPVTLQQRNPITQANNVTRAIGFSADITAGTLQFRSQVRGQYAPAPQ